jgi:uncharacterized protein YyaL (SSP411 family)
MTSHPHFVSANVWYTRLDDALAAAAASGKRVFLQVGRQSCAGSRALVERTLAKEEVADFLASRFVSLAGDADRPEPQVAAIVAGLPQHAPTPLCIYLAADGRVLASSAGGRPPAVLLNDMLSALAKK